MISLVKDLSLLINTSNGRSNISVKNWFFIMSACAICRERGGVYADNCKDTDSCRLRVCFPVTDRSYKTTRKFYGLSSLAKHLGGIEVEYQRIAAAQNLLKVALSFIENPVDGPFGQDYQRLRTLEQVCRCLAKSLISMARGFDQLVELVSHKPEVVAPNAEGMAKQILQVNGIELEDVKILDNTFEQNFNELFNYVQNMPQQVHPPAIEQSIYQQEPIPYQPQMEPYPPYQSWIEPYQLWNEPYPPYPSHYQRRTTAYRPYLRLTEPYQPYRRPAEPHQPEITPYEPQLNQPPTPPLPRPN